MIRAVGIAIAIMIGLGAVASSAENERLKQIELRLECLREIPESRTDPQATFHPACGALFQLSQEERERNCKKLFTNSQAINSLGYENPQCSEALK